MTALRTPLYDWHVAHKARMVPFGGWDMPVQYSGIVDEHKAVRERSGLFDISHMGRLTFHGADALPFLERLCTNAIGTMKIGQVRYSLLCNEAGGILDDILVYRWADHFGMVVNASNREKILAWLEAQRPGQQVTIHDHTSRIGMLAIQGPLAMQQVAGLFRLDPQTLGYYHAATTQWEGNTCTISRTGYTGEDGIEVMIDSSVLATLADLLVDRGAIPCGLGARDTLRLEAAMPLYGHELSETIDPLQAGLGWAVKLGKGDFVGKAGILQRQADTNRPIRIGIQVEGKRAAREGTPVLHGDQPIGQVTSGSFTPTVERVIGMAYVPPSLATPGTALNVDIRGQIVPAVVVPLPFYKRK